MSVRLKWGVTTAIAVAALAIAGFAVWEYGRGRAWWGESDVMRMVRSEALANPSSLGLQLTGSRREQQSDSLTTSGPVVINCFAAPGGKPELRLVIDLAISDGWIESPGTRTPTTWAGRKPAEPGGVMNTVLTLDGNGVCDPGDLSVLVSY